MAKYKIGDTLVGVNHIVDLELNGMECTVIGIWEAGEVAVYSSSLGETEDDAVKSTEMRYKVEWANGRVLAAKEVNLKRKDEPSRGDMDEVVSWEDMPWIPSEKKCLQDY